MRPIKLGSRQTQAAEESNKVPTGSSQDWPEGIKITLTKRFALLLFGVTLLVGGIMALAVVLVMGLRGQQSLIRPALLPDTDQVARVIRSNTPRWGELVEYDVEFEKPDDYFVIPQGTNFATRWFFGGYSKSQVQQFAVGAGLSAEQAAALVNAGDCAVVSNGVWVTPGSDLVFGLNPSSRKTLYEELAKFQENERYASPFSFSKETVDQWSKENRLPTKTIELLKRFLYKRGTALCFSDLLELMNRVPQADERLRLLDTLWRRPAVLVKLRIRPDTDINQLMAYWGRGYHAKDFRPLFESLARLPEGGSLDVVHLLPPFARRRLYTYPAPSTLASDRGKDCMWTSMNFFNETPDDRFLDKPVVVSTLKSDYALVPTPSQFGDLVFWLDRQGEVVHSAVFIADNIVFTKNGSSHLEPWTLMRMEDVFVVYPSEETLNQVFYRSKMD